jgi:RimJ/RimL family protein N-acetyltransferase
MKIERTHDMQLVAQILGHPAIWPHIHEDGVDAPAPIDHDSLHWMLITEDEKPVGVFLVHGVSTVCYQMHTCLLPQIWGVGAAKAAQMLARWVFDETPCLKLITNVPAYNRRALRFAEAGGMVREGINRASFLRNGEPIDQIVLGITKKEWKSCRQQSLLQS